MLLLLPRSDDRARRRRFFQFVENSIGMGLDDLKCYMHIVFRCILSTNSKTNNKRLVDHRWNHMQLTRVIQIHQQLLGQFILALKRTKGCKATARILLIYLQTKTNETEDDIADDFETLIFVDQRRKEFRQSAMLEESGAFLSLYRCCRVDLLLECNHEDLRHRNFEW